MTRLGDLLDFGQLFKAFGKNYFAQIVHISRQFCKGFKIFHCSSEIIFWATFIDIWQLFTGHTAEEEHFSRSMEARNRIGPIHSNQGILTYFVRGSITVQLTSCLDSTKLINLLKI